MPQREIEVKAKVRDLIQLEKKLHALGCVFSSPIHQLDRIFIPIGKTIPIGKGVNALRIRREKDRILFTLKQVHDDPLDKIEKEFTIDNEEQAVEAILLLGFFESVSVEKSRRKCRYHDYEICLDTVTDLGAFIEVEKISSDSGEVVQQELFRFLESLGVKKEDQVFQGYDILLHRKRQEIA